MPHITCQQASQIVEGVRAAARAAGLAPVAVAVVDAGGHPVVISREDGASYLRWRIALEKARSAVAMGVPSAELTKIFSTRGDFARALSTMHTLIPAAGGVLMRESGGVLLGAVGVSGDTSEKDAAAAAAGITAVGLTAVTEIPA